MQLAALKPSILIAGVLSATLCLYPQSAPTESDAHGGEPQALPPRATPADYQAHVRAGAVTVAAEFTGHFVPLPQGTLTTEDYVVVETGLFGGPGTRLQLSVSDFSLRINGKKPALPSQPYGLVTGSLKDPDLEPLASASKSKTGLGTGGGQGDSNAPPPPVHIPVEVRRAMALRLQKASLTEGERPLPQAGLIFFRYGGKSKGIQSVELIYNGPAGQAILALQP
jgi:hypothetical protein